MKLLSMTLLIMASLHAVQGWRALHHTCEYPEEDNGMQFMMDTEEVFCLFFR
jgi:hypothetical protein